MLLILLHYDWLSLFSWNFLAEIERKEEEGQKVVIPLSSLIITAMDEKHST